MISARLGATMRIPVIRMEALRNCTPAFEVLPFNECAQKACALVRDESGGLLLVADDPFSTDLELWATERLADRFAFRLALETFPEFRDGIDRIACRIRNVPAGQFTSRRVNDSGAKRDVRIPRK